MSDYSIGDGFGEVIEAMIKKKSPLCEKNLITVELPKGIRIGSIFRDNRIIIPNSNTIFKENDDVFLKMMNKVRGRETLNEEVAVDAKANKSTIKKLAKELPNDADLGSKCRQLIKKDGDCSQELKDLAKENPNDADLGAVCRKMCK